jgi:glutaminyl-peptide cyclotransferase
MGRTTLVALIAIISVVAGCTATPDTYQKSAPTQLRAEVIQQIPHDPKAFTEGLELVGGVLYESTGNEGSSTIRTVDPATGTVTRKADLAKELFGEGITVVDQTIWQLTWQNGIAIQRDRGTFAELQRVRYTGEGWGLCYDQAGHRLIMSDGTDRLTFLDPTTFQQLGEVHITSGGKPITKLNELECAHGAVFANVWTTDTIVRIDPAAATVTADIDLAGLLPADVRQQVDVLNGIAAVPDTDDFLVTGKYWPKMFRVRFVPAAT